MTNLEERLSALGHVLDEHYGPIALHELGEPPQTHGDHLTVVDLGEPDESAARPPWRRRVIVGAAAALLLVMGFVVVDGDRGDEVTDPASSPTAPDTVPSPSAAAAPSVLDPVSSYRWSRIPDDEAVFGEQFEEWMSSVTVGGPGLVAVGSAVWTSVDGLTWSRVPDDAAVFADSPIHDVTAGGPGLVAVGVAPVEVGAETGGAAVWTSPDGITWSRVSHDDAVFGGADMRSVTVGGPGLVAVGWDGHPHGEESNAVVWTSPDGFTWTRVPHDEAIFGGVTGAWMWSVAAGGPGLVAVGDATDGAAVWTSPDGITWSRIPHDDAVFGDAAMGSVTAAGPGLVAVGEDWDTMGAAVWTSPDGFTWSRVPHDEVIFGEEGAHMASVTAGGPGLVAVGGDRQLRGQDNDAAVWTSPDGITWSRVPHDDAIFGAQPKPVLAMTSVVVGGPGLVAVGANHVHDTSGATDGEAAVWVATFED